MLVALGSVHRAFRGFAVKLLHEVRHALRLGHRRRGFELAPELVVRPEVPHGSRRRPVGQSDRRSSLHERRGVARDALEAFLEPRRGEASAPARARHRRVGRRASRLAPPNRVREQTRALRVSARFAQARVAPTRGREVLVERAHVGRRARGGVVPGVARSSRRRTGGSRAGRTRRRFRRSERPALRRERLRLGAGDGTRGGCFSGRGLPAVLFLGAFEGTGRRLARRDGRVLRVLRVLRVDDCRGRIELRLDRFASDPLGG